MEKQRLDKLLVDRGLLESRERAKLAISEGVVTVDGKPVTKPGALVPENALLELRGETLRYVSRGGLKLERAVEVFGLTLDGLTAADIGASAGGFTDCMLQNGAAHVYAIDVGSDQLSPKLRADPRVTVMEQTDARSVTPAQLGGGVDFATVDVSFISTRLILPALEGLLKEKGRAVVLVKPQFEAGRGKVGKKGVVRDPKVHREVLEGFLASAQSAGFGVLGLDYSPITGPEGNIEYLALLQKGAESAVIDSAEIVRRSHANFGKGR